MVDIGPGKRIWGQGNLALGTISCNFNGGSVAKLPTRMSGIVDTSAVAFRITQLVGVVSSKGRRFCREIR